MLLEHGSSVVICAQVVGRACCSGELMSQVCVPNTCNSASSTTMAVPLNHAIAADCWVRSAWYNGLERSHWCSGSTLNAATQAHRGQRPCGAGTIEGLKVPMRLARAGAPSSAGPAIIGSFKSSSKGPSSIFNTCTISAARRVSLGGRAVSAAWPTSLRRKPPKKGARMRTEARRGIVHP
jgi:hypothetical protein